MSWREVGIEGEKGMVTGDEYDEYDVIMGQTDKIRDAV